MPEEPDDQPVVTLSYARTHLHALIREVQAGKLVHIRRRDGLSATLAPYRPDSEKTPR
jgi:antitoxin (DNA-binding transcriptional repressor) of toxin-antitoxin stability system